MEDSIERRNRVMRFLNEEVWPLVPEELLGHRHTPDEVLQILGDDVSSA